MTIGRERRAGVAQDDKAEGLCFGGNKMLAGVIKVFLFFWKKGFNCSCLKCADRNGVVS